MSKTPPKTLVQIQLATQCQEAVKVTSDRLENLNSVSQLHLVLPKDDAIELLVLLSGSLRTATVRAKKRQKSFKEVKADKLALNKAINTTTEVYSQLWEQTND